MHTAPENSTTLHAADTLEGGTVLPGFALSVQAFFADSTDKATVKNASARSCSRGTGHAGVGVFTVTEEAPPGRQRLRF